MRTYHYEYFCYTDNLNYGRMFLGKAKTKSEAESIGRWSGKGCFTVKKRRVWHE